MLEDTAALDADRRWKDAELEVWANECIRQIITLDPAESPVTVTHTLSAGAYQTLLATDLYLLDVIGNTGGAQIRMTDRATLDTTFPGWQQDTAKGTIKDVMYDPKNRRVFWTYPPAINGTRIDIVVSQFPVDVTILSAFPLSDLYFNLAAEYICYRAHSKDAEEAVAARAVAHLKLFNDGVAAITARSAPPITAT